MEAALFSDAEVVGAKAEQPIEESETVSIVVDNGATTVPCKCMEDKFKSLDDALQDKAGEGEPSNPRIQKVPFMLRDHKGFEQHYEPRVVSIGPIHHGNPKLRLAEKLKLKLAAHFIKESRKTKEFLYSRVENDIENLRECYEKEVTKPYDSKELAWILFVDGCAVLQFTSCVTANEADKKLEELKMKRDHVAFAQQDMFLLENQIPYRLLRLLIELSTQHKLLNKAIQKFINNNIMAPSDDNEEPDPEPDPEQEAEPKQKLHQLLQNKSVKQEPVHLLQLLRSKLLGVQPTRKGRTKGCGSILEWCKKIQQRRKGRRVKDWESFRNITELKTSGILLKKSKTVCLTDITFTRICCVATLKLPALIVDDSTASKFLNLIAFEMCPDFFNDFGISSYVWFLDSLIDQPEDVKILREAGILHNVLGSDKEVAKLFNEISTDLVPNPDAYSKVKARIQDHCDNQWTTWVAQGFNEHFSSPWTGLAFLGAIAALVLSFLQTYYTIRPVK